MRSDFKAGKTRFSEKMILAAAYGFVALCYCGFALAGLFAIVVAVVVAGTMIASDGLIEKVRLLSLRPAVPRT